jgi:septum formation protein
VKLLLASSSRTRQRMLRDAGVPFDTVRSSLDEEAAKERLVETGFAPRDLAEMLAELKAVAVAAPAETLVLGADQTLERDDGALLGKPADLDQARDQLLSLRGRVHRLHSAAVLAVEGRRCWGMVETVTLTVRDFSDSFLEDYLRREGEAVLWSAGGYRLEGLGAQLFESVGGSHFAVLGLPLLPLLEELRRRGLLAS